MLNYEKRLIIMTYCKNIKGLVELDGEAPTVFQVRPVAHTPVVRAVLALRDPIIFRHFLCS
jgi:hypothetical protein